MIQHATLRVGQTLREIEAELINAEFDHVLAKRRRKANVASDSDVEDVLKRARILLARLPDMRDEVGRRRAEVDFDRSIAEVELAAARSAEGPALERAYRAKLAELKAGRIRRELDILDERAKKIDRFVAWIRERFPDAKLTILDVAPAEKEAK